MMESRVVLIMYLTSRCSRKILGRFLRAMMMSHEQVWFFMLMSTRCSSIAFVYKVVFYQVTKQILIRGCGGLGSFAPDGFLLCGLCGVMPLALLWYYGAMTVVVIVALL